MVVAVSNSIQSLPPRSSGAGFKLAGAFSAFACCFDFSKVLLSAALAEHSKCCARQLHFSDLASTNTTDQILDTLFLALPTTNPTTTTAQTLRKIPRTPLQ